MFMGVFRYLGDKNPVCLMSMNPLLWSVTRMRTSALSSLSDDGDGFKILFMPARTVEHPLVMKGMSEVKGIRWIASSCQRL